MRRDKIEKRNRKLNEYPCDVYLHNALRFIADGKLQIAYEEICYAIIKSGGELTEAESQFDVSKINTNNWIPVSQQLPYEGGKYMKSVLVTMEDCKGGRFVTNTLDRNVTRENKIVAWMPVPDVYKGEA